jgi:hypothetical protein
MRYAVRTMTISSGSRNFIININQSIYPQSYHLEIGGQYININGNFMSDGTKGIVLNGTANVVISGNQSRDLSEDGLFEASASTLTFFGTNQWGAGDKIDGVPWSMPLIQDGDVPSENMTGVAQLYIESGVPKIRLADGTIKTITVT